MSAISANVEMVLGEINTNNAKATAYAVAFVYILLLTKKSAHKRGGNLERVMGIEPTQSAWKADVLPLNYTRKSKVQNGFYHPFTTMSTEQGNKATRSHSVN